jgi:SAM-dependent methyltransferase
MPHQDALRWDDRYREDKRYTSFMRPRPFLLDHAHLLPECGLALDLAMGLGGNARFLISRGLRVVGVDISRTAVWQAKYKNPELMAVLADLAEFYLPAGKFNLVLDFYYLQRELWPSIRKSLCPGGLLVIETLTRDMLQVNPEIDPVNLLEPGELHASFANWEILAYREGWLQTESAHPRAVASLVGRSPD